MNLAKSEFAVAHADLSNSRTYPGGLVSFLVCSAETGGDFSLFEANMRPGQELPLHMHEQRNVLFYVLEGEMDIASGEQISKAVAGTTVYLAPRTPHTYRVLSDTARFLVLMQPSLGVEGFFESLSEPAKTMTPPKDETGPASSDANAVLELGLRHGVKFIGK
jgi:mannose-6-phosphate isomerase-like protein (cupin superfamily)